MRLTLGTRATQYSGDPGELALTTQYLQIARQGFATVAIAAGVPIIPVFTENIREATLCLSGRMNVGRGLWEYIYETTKMPLVPMYGLFPVKLRTHLGKPIYPTPGCFLSNYFVVLQTTDNLRDETRGDGEFDVKCSPTDDRPASTTAW